jgi:hypothetical protein
VFLKSATNISQEGTHLGDWHIFSLLDKTMKSELLKIVGWFFHLRKGWSSMTFPSFSIPILGSQKNTQVDSGLIVAGVGGKTNSIASSEQELDTAGLHLLIILIILIYLFEGWMLS